MLGIITPSVNTCVEPEYEAMRPAGVTHQLSRMLMENTKIHDDKDFVKVVEEIDRAVEPAIERLLPARPDHLVVGVSIEAVWGGKEGGEALRRRVEEKSGISATLAGDALLVAIETLGITGSIAVLGPYRAPGMAQVKNYFSEFGIDVVRTHTLVHDRPLEIAHFSKRDVALALRSLDGPDISAIIQFGANAAVAEVAAQGARWLGKPVVAVNVATYWHALRQIGIKDRMTGFGPLLEFH